MAKRPLLALQDNIRRHPVVWLAAILSALALAGCGAGYMAAGTHQKGGDLPPGHSEFGSSPQTRGATNSNRQRVTTDTTPNPARRTSSAPGTDQGTSSLRPSATWAIQPSTTRTAYQSPSPTPSGTPPLCIYIICLP
jgi:hypothetical protein